MSLAGRQARRTPKTPLSIAYRWHCRRNDGASRNCSPSILPQRETKVEKLIGALGVLWRENPQERMVVFATYLGSVEMLGAEIEKQYPGQGVTVLKGGDHGAKAAAEKRFKAADGPRVLICTAAGREGINLQHARILFNFDLPWNPMDLEQRIGRIHRYGQHNTAQVYNLVLSDTIEGSIFLLLDEKLKEIGRALGKVDEHGQIAEDLRTQILGQLSMQVNYASLYSEALSDPQLKRTRVELEAAMSNAVEARKVVFELFQDLDGFRLDDYKAMGNPDEGMDDWCNSSPMRRAPKDETFKTRETIYSRGSTRTHRPKTLLTTERELSLQNENIQLLGLRPSTRHRPPTEVPRPPARGTRRVRAIPRWRERYSGRLVSRSSRRQRAGEACDHPACRR